MRILFDAPTVMYNYWSKALKELGIEVTAAPRKVENFAAFIKFAEEFNPDIILGSVYIRTERYDLIYKHIPQWCKKKGITSVWSTTQDPNFCEATRNQALLYDYVFTPAAECVEEYKSIGCKKVGILPLGYNETWSVYEDVPKIYDIVLLGNYYLPTTERACYGKHKDGHSIKPGYKNIIEPLVKRGYNIKIWGHKENWLKSGLIEEKNLMGIIGYASHAKIYNQAKICIAINSNQFSPTMLSWRTYEILACRAFMLSAWSQATENLGTIGEDFVVSRSPEQTISLVDKYLEENDERERIARNGQKAVLGIHSTKRRAQQMLEFIRVNGGY